MCSFTTLSQLLVALTMNLSGVHVTKLSHYRKASRSLKFDDRGCTYVCMCIHKIHVCIYRHIYIYMCIHTHKLVYVRASLYL